MEYEATEEDGGEPAEELAPLFCFPPNSSSDSDERMRDDDNVSLASIDSSVPCVVCDMAEYGDADDDMILFDWCNDCFHLRCLDPAL